MMVATEVTVVAVMVDMEAKATLGRAPTGVTAALLVTVATALCMTGATEVTEWGGGAPGYGRGARDYGGRGAGDSGGRGTGGRYDLTSGKAK